MNTLGDNRRERERERERVKKKKEKKSHNLLHPLHSHSIIPFLLLLVKKEFTFENWKKSRHYFLSNEEETTFWWWWWCCDDGMN